LQDPLSLQLLELRFGRLKLFGFVLTIGGPFVEM
jgi:hypothetical protein